MNNNMGFTLDLLPMEMVEEILARLAASSRTALFNAKMSCALFNRVANSNYIYRCVSLDGLPQSSTMKSEEYKFYLKCMTNENPEAFYKEGVDCFIRDPSKEFGLLCLDKAASLGHPIAAYILGINLICCGIEKDRQRGIELLGKIKTSHAMRQCRNKLKSILFYSSASSIKWSIERTFLSCPLVKKTPAWPLRDDEEDRMSCQVCRWNVEINHVYCILHEIYYLDNPDRCEIIIE